ncbi:hypothetical protein HDV03_005117 [Kappamyces sp. JEL0829]|nr:hypothetical protein HDV03_005117 [Kappamyces sp. JEL0829]
MSPERERRDRSPRASRESPPRNAPVDPHERDKRTVFCQQLSARLSNRDLYDFLSVCGRIREAKIVQDKMSRRSKGVAYVEFYDEESVPKAIGMTGHRILGIPIIISASESEKNVEAEQKAALAAAAAGLPIEREIVRPEVVTNKLFVGNLALSVTEEDLRILFEACGRLETVKLHFDSFTGRSKGFALVVFRTTYDAKFAIKKLNAHVLKGKQIEVRPVGNDDKMGIKDWDDSETQGVSLNSLSRVELMAKLARDEVRTTTSSGSTRITPAMHVYDDSPCVLLKNMFDPAEESGSHWVREIEADVAEECSKFVDPKSAGFIYLKFDGPDAAKRAVSSLNGRFFAGKSISAGQLADSLYYAKYPAAASK